jgi:indole-3-glycerol phosphate synthase
VSSRRLSQAIAEGDGISLLVEVAHPSDGAAATAYGAEGLVVRSAGAAATGAAMLPVLAFGISPDAAAQAGADAVVLAAAVSDERLHELTERALELGLEPVIQVLDEDDLERVLEELDPEILLLSPDGADDEQEPLDRLLELLPDVPAGKLAIADLSGASRADVEELERAGVDAVVVAGDVDGLAGDSPPEV